MTKKRTSKKRTSKKHDPKRRSSKKPTVFVLGPPEPRVRIPARFARRMTKRWKKADWGVDVLPGPDYFLVQAMSRTGRAVELHVYPKPSGGIRVVLALMVGDVTRSDVTKVLKMAHQILWTLTGGVEANGKRRSSQSSDVRNLIDKAKDAGWRVEFTANNHVRLYPPDPSKPSVGTGMSKSMDPHALKNFRAALRRSGLDV